MDAQTQFLLDYDGGSLRESTRFIVCVEVPVNFRLQRFAKTSAYRILGPNRNSGTVSLIGHLQQWVFPEVIDFFAPPRAEFLLGGKPTYMSEDSSQTSNQSG
jgi:hypothetical protein